jgi:hypothetical protein
VTSISTMSDDALAAGSVLAAGQTGAHVIDAASAIHSSRPIEVRRQIMPRGYHGAPVPAIDKYSLSRVAHLARVRA